MTCKCRTLVVERQWIKKVDGPQKTSVFSDFPSRVKTFSRISRNVMTGRMNFHLANRLLEWYEVIPAFNKSIKY